MANDNLPKIQNKRQLTHFYYQKWQNSIFPLFGTYIFFSMDKIIFYWKFNLNISFSIIISSLLHSLLWLSWQIDVKIIHSHKKLVNRLNITFDQNLLFLLLAITLWFSNSIRLCTLHNNKINTNYSTMKMFKLFLSACLLGLAQAASLYLF